MLVRRMMAFLALTCLLAVGTMAQEKKGTGGRKPSVAAPEKTKTATLKIEGMH